MVACIVDSGIALDHTDFESVNLVVEGFHQRKQRTYDDHGHGTSMAGLLVANGWLKGMAKKWTLGGEGARFGWKRQRHPRR